MAIYRNIQMSFWTDTKVADEFTPEDRYFYLYLFTNPHTNLAGCYEISLRTMANETGYSKESIEKLIERLKTTHKVIDYCNETKEVLIINWHKYNWTSSGKFRIPLFKQIEAIKYDKFRDFLTDIFNYSDTVSIPYPYGTDTTVTVNNIKETYILEDTKSIKNTYIDTINNIITEHNYSIDISNILVEWFQYKKEKGQTYKPIGIKKLLNKIDKILEKYTEQEVIDLINECMERNYQGIIFEILEKKKTGSTGSAYMDAIKNRVNVVDDWV